jgi:endonuclease V-like protein UPF0215 family
VGFMGLGDEGCACSAVVMYVGVSVEDMFVVDIVQREITLGGGEGLNVGRGNSELFLNVSFESLGLPLILLSLLFAFAFFNIPSTWYQVD